MLYTLVGSLSINALFTLDHVLNSGSASLTDIITNIMQHWIVAVMFTEVTPCNGKPWAECSFGRSPPGLRVHNSDHTYHLQYWFL